MGSSVEAGSGGKLKSANAAAVHVEGSCTKDHQMNDSP